MDGSIVTSWGIYWLTRLDSICITLGVLAIVSLISAVIMGIWWGINKDDGDPTDIPRKCFYKSAISFATLIIILTFIPSTKEAIVVWLVPKIANNEKVQQVPEKALILLNNKLDEWINDQLGKKEKNKK